MAAQTFSPALRGIDAALPLRPLEGAKALIFRCGIAAHTGLYLFPQIPLISGARAVSVQ